MNNSAWDKARIRATMKLYEASGKTIPVNFIQQGQRGILITEALKIFMESAMRGYSTVKVHDLKHTFGKRLRSCRVVLETRKVMLGHKNGDITSHYSAPEIEELLEAANRVCQFNSVKSPSITLLKRKIS